jgi:hypothetical protein
MLVQARARPVTSSAACFNAHMCELLGQVFMGYQGQSENIDALSKRNN